MPLHLSRVPGEQVLIDMPGGGRIQVVVESPEDYIHRYRVIAPEDVTVRADDSLQEGRPVRVTQIHTADGDVTIVGDDTRERQVRLEIIAPRTFTISRVDLEKRPRDKPPTTRRRRNR